MWRKEINIRDPYVLVHNGMYYLYGTRAETTWGKADGFDCYRSRDLKEWEGPFEIFHRPEGFWADQEYWAPECVQFADAFYLVTTFGAEDRKKGIYVLRAEEPEGPFVPYGERLTPEDWACIDGTVYFEGETPYLVFSHSFEDTPDGDMCCVKLANDLSHAEGDVVRLFSAAEAPWAKPVPFAKEEFGMDGDVYFTDGPYLMKLGGTLYMTWSSWSRGGYAVGTAVSESGQLTGPWKQCEEPLFPENGGHGMLFADIGGQLRFAMHFPNDRYKERPLFYGIAQEGGKLVLREADE